MASQLLMPPTPPQASKLSSEQSLQLVQIFINSSLACICHTRELLNWSSDCFRRRFIDDVSLEHDAGEIYNAFCGMESPSTKPSQELRVLVRSSSSRANGVLDMIENGVFDALKRSYLDILHVFVTSKAGQDDSILETYTYTFEYLAGHVTNVRIAESGNTFSLADSQKSFKAAIKALLRMMKDLPTLPKKRALGMCMSFTPDCPGSYQPEGFCSAEDHSIALDDWHELWQIPPNEVTFEAAHHMVRIATRNKQYEGQSTSQLQDTLMSKQLHNMQRTSSNRNVGINSTLPVQVTPASYLKEVAKPKEQTQPEKGRHELVSEHHSEPTAQGNEANPSPRRRKISISGRFIQVDRSSPCVSADEGIGVMASRGSDMTDWSEDDFN